MFHKKYVKPSALTRLLMILNATTGPGPQIPPVNPPAALVPIDNSHFPRAPDPTSGSGNIPPILPVPDVAPRFGDVSGSLASSFPNDNPFVPAPGADADIDASVLESIFGPDPSKNNVDRAPARPVYESEALSAITQSANTFSSNFFRYIGEAFGGNIVVSAVSAWMVLAMAMYGARGDTECQMLNALALPANDDITERGFQALIDRFENYKVAEVRIANKIFINQDITPKAEFREMTRTAFRSEVENVNFDNPVEAANIINGWCENQTNGRITDVFVPEDLDPTTAMILLNAVYFKGQWKSRFNRYKTGLGAFRVNSSATVDVLMMFNSGNYRTGYLDDVKARFIEIPYESAGVEDALSMFIVMPDDVDGLPELETKMDQITIERLSDGEDATTRLFLPKFSIESTMPLDDVLETMHMGGIFGNNADFTGIIDFPPISVTRVVQKAFIEVNEEGTEAAAASGSDLEIRMMPLEFHVDRPFIGFIGAPRTTDSVMLFSFRYTGPAST